METNVQLHSWREGINISFDIYRWSTGERNVDGLLVTFSGTYRPGSAGNPDGRFIAMVMAAALAWETGHGAVIDLSALDYVGGDYLSYWSSFIPDSRRKAPKGFPVATCCSQSNIDAVRSLFASEGDDEQARAIYLDREQAIQSIIQRLRQP
jgi:hypothetical protein